MKKALISITFFICVVLLISILVFLEAKRQEKIVQNIQQEQKQEISIQDNNRQETDLSDWKTYRNEKFGFKLEFPESWYSKECEDEDGVHVAFDGSLKALESLCTCPDNQPCYPGKIFIEIKNKNSQNLSYLEDEISFLTEFQNFEKNYKKIELIVADIPATKIYHNNELRNYVYFENDKYFFKFIYQETERPDSFEARDYFEHILSTFKFSENNDLSGIETKKVRISDGDVAFSFEIPSDWLVETRHSGEKQLNIEEMREFLAGNNVEDLKNNPKEYSDYCDMPWAELEKMSEEEVKKLYNNELFPNASVTADSHIWYTDINWDQIDFYIKNESVSDIIESEKELEDYCKNKNEYFVGCGLKAPTWSNEIVGGRKVEVKNYYIDKDEEGNERASKGGTGGKGYFIGIPNSNKTLVIEKQAKVEGEFENGFEYLIKTFVFEK